MKSKKEIENMRTKIMNLLEKTLMEIKYNDLGLHNLPICYLRFHIQILDWVLDKEIKKED